MGKWVVGSYAMVIAIDVAQTAMMTAMTIKSESYQVTLRSIDILAASGPMTDSVKAEKAPMRRGKQVSLSCGWVP